MITPDVSFQYDRLGRQKTITDVLGTRTNSYDTTTLALTSERLPDGTVLSRIQDTLGRSTGFAASPAYAVSYAYDSLGRFSSVTSGLSVVNYSYLAGSYLLAGWTAGPLTVSRSFEPHRNLLTQVRTMAGTNTVSQFDYQNDAIGRRTRRLDLLAGYGLPVTNLFGYNSRSELTLADMGTNTYGYAFDPIGNREWASLNAVTNLYAANVLNQYTNVLAAMPLREDIPTYDEDGNILRLRDWTLEWDAENRLVLASNATVTVRYAHDFMGRRVWRAADGVTNRFDYDGWALIRERTYSQTQTLTNSYIYGLDLSGTLQGAGTIGGLWARVGEGGVLYYAFDGNGNVTDLVDTSGAQRGHYEYTPFGEVSTMTGDLAASNPFRFSTKRQDESTGLIYYGYRDLDAVWGRWVNRDPVAERGGNNMFTYLVNDALNKDDYLGMLPLVPERPSVAGNVGCGLNEAGECVKLVVGCDQWPKILQSCCQTHEEKHIEQSEGSDWCTLQDKVVKLSDGSLYTCKECKGLGLPMKYPDISMTQKEAECPAHIVSITCMNGKLINGGLSDQETLTLKCRIIKECELMEGYGCENADFPDICKKAKTWAKDCDISAK